MLKVLVLASILVLLPGRILSFPSGQPGQEEDCRTMRPNHGLNIPQKHPRPFDIIVNQDKYATSDSLTVTIKMRGNEKFKGFAIQARRVDQNSDRDEIVGFFQNIQGTKLVCSQYRGAQQIGNGLTHTNESGGSRDPKSTLSFTWSPRASHGHIQFRVTVVIGFDTFWVAEPSQTIYDEMVLGGIRPSSTPSTGCARPDLTVDGCGRTKGCYRNPASCTPGTCDILVTWKISDTPGYYEFAMFADSEGWVAVGFSDDMKMGGEDVFECVYNESNSKIHIDNSRNTDSGKNNEVRSPSRFPRDCGEGKLENRRIWCYFRVQENRNLPRNEKYHIFMAKGAVDKHGIKMRHVLEPNKYPYVSARKVAIEDRVDLTDTARYALVKVHGCLMLIGWMMCASTALILAKYYKPMWPNDRLCGERVWFAVHRGCMVVNLFATVIAFIIIFIHANGYSQMPDLPAKAHPILGIITTCLCVLNPLIALCKCHDKSDKRPIFNWIHWFVGTCATVLATPTLFIGLNLPKAHVPWWATWVMVAFMLFHLIIELMLEIHGCLNANKQKYRTQEYEMRRPKDDREQEPVGKRFKKIILTLYLIVVICLGIVMVISVAAG